MSIAAVDQDPIIVPRQHQSSTLIGKPLEWTVDPLQSLQAPTSTSTAHPPGRMSLIRALNRPLVDPNTDNGPAHHIIASPYTLPTHTLDLGRLSWSSALFAQALQVLEPVGEGFAVEPYEEAFNWDDVFGELRRLVNARQARKQRNEKKECEIAGHEEDKREDMKTNGVKWEKTDFYVVAFRSVLRDLNDAEKERLGQLDEKSHEEAVQSGGLLKYWFGVPDETKRNLATCFWHSRSNAVDGGRGPWHCEARKAGISMYESMGFETRRLTIEEGVRGWAWAD